MRSAIIFCKAAVSLADCEQVGGFFAMAMLSAILAGSLQDFVNGLEAPLENLLLEDHVVILGWTDVTVPIGSSFRESSTAK